jgi:hypothetical protein
VRQRSALELNRNRRALTPEEECFTHHIAVNAGG